MEAYRLRPWTETNSRNLSDLITKGEWQSMAEDAFEMTYWQYASYASPFLYEQILRYPDSPARRDVTWQAASMNPSSWQLAGLRPGQDVFSYLVEDLLNQQGVTVDELPDKLQGYGFRINESLRINNLFGDGQEALVLQVSSNHWLDSVGYFAVRQVNGVFRLEVLKNWSNIDIFHRSLDIDQVIDSNGNGIPEVGIVYQGASSGTPGVCFKSLFLYEWQGNVFTALADNLTIFLYSLADGPCEGSWGFGEASSSGVPALILKEKRYTTNDDVVTSKSCPYLEIQHIYTWDGQGYILERDEWAASSSEDAACQIAWAYVDANIQIVENGVWDQRAIDILADQLEHWPDQADEVFGPASRDFFALQLGIWRDLRGEGDQAMALLQPLAKKPTVAEYDLPSRLAASYLEGRDRGGLQEACFQVNADFKKLDAEYLVETFDWQHFSEQFRQEWGFFGPWSNYWVFVPELCDHERGLKVDISLQIMQSRSALEGWLAQIGFTWLAIKPADLNADGVQDWLVVLADSQDTVNDEAYLWAFLDAPAHGSAILLDHVWPYTQPLTLTWQAVIPEAGSPPLNLIFAGEVLRGYKLSANKIVSEWHLGSAVITYQVDERPEGAVITVTEKTEGGTENSVYIWDSRERDFIYVPDYDFKAAQAEAERLLFQKRDYQAAIAFIEKFLADAPPEPQWPQRGPDWYHPYLRYLLGIAYEMAGFPEQATQVYYELWRNYPDHLYGIAAALKLEPIGTHP